MSKIFFNTVAIIVIIILAASFSPSEAANKISLNYCPQQQTCSSTNWQCQTETYPTDTCLSRVVGFNGMSVKFRCAGQQTICINATGYSDSACTQKQSDLNAVC